MGKIMDSIKGALTGQGWGSGTRSTDSYSSSVRPYAERRNKRENNQRIAHHRRLSEHEIAELYRRNRIVRRVCDTLPLLALNGIPSTKHDKKKDFEQLLTDIKAVRAVRRAAIWGCAFGLGGVLMDVDDRLPLSLPMNLARVSKIIQLKALSKRRLRPADPGAGLESEFWHVRGGTAINGELVHRSRLLIFGGEETDEDTMLANGGMPESMLDQLYRTIVKFFDAHDNASTVLDRFSQFVLSIDNLDAYLADDDDEMIINKVALIDELRDLWGTMAIDKKDGVDYKSMNLSNFDRIVELIKQLLVIELGWPETLVFGTSPKGSGLANGGESELNQLQMLVGLFRADRMDDQWDYLLSIVAVCLKTDKPDWDYQPLDKPKLLDLLKAREAQTRIDAGNVQMGVYGEKTIVKNRFSGEYSFETEIDPEDLDALDDPGNAPEPPGFDDPDLDDDELEEGEDLGDDEEDKTAQNPKKPVSKAPRK